MFIRFVVTGSDCKRSGGLNGDPNLTSCGCQISPLSGISMSVCGRKNDIVYPSLFYFGDAGGQGHQNSRFNLRPVTEKIGPGQGTG